MNRADPSGCLSEWAKAGLIIGTSVLFVGAVSVFTFGTGSAAAVMLAYAVYGAAIVSVGGAAVGYAVTGTASGAAEGAAIGFGVGASGGLTYGTSLIPLAQNPELLERGYTTYRALKKAIGAAGEGFEWHHLVEQCQGKRLGISNWRMHNLNNIIKLPVWVHREISKFYSSKPDFTNGLTVRDWLTSSGMSFEEQLKYGISKLEEYGCVVIENGRYVFYEN